MARTRLYSYSILNLSFSLSTIDNHHWSYYWKQEQIKIDTIISFFEALFLIKKICIWKKATKWIEQSSHFSAFHTCQTQKVHTSTCWGNLISHIMGDCTGGEMSLSKNLQATGPLGATAFDPILQSSLMLYLFILTTVSVLSLAVSEVAHLFHIPSSLQRKLGKVHD